MIPAGTAEHDSVRTAWLVGACLIVVFMVLAAMSASTRFDGPAQELDRLLTTAASAVAFVVVVYFIVTARHRNRVSNLLLAAGTLTLSSISWAIGELTPLIDADVSTPTFASLRNFSLVAVFALLGAGLRYRATAAVRVLALIPFAATGAIAAALAVTDTTQGNGLMTIGWASLVVAYSLAYARSRDVTTAWVAVAFIGYLLGDLGRTATVGAEAAWVLATGVVRVLASVFLILGLIEELAHTSIRQQAQLAQSARRLEALEAVSAAAARRIDERDHQARSALAAIEYSAEALKRYGANLDEAAIHQVETAMTAEIELLRRLITLPDPREPPVPFSVHPTVEGIVHAKRMSGMEIEYEPAAEAVAVGIPGATREILQVMLDNAQTHAFGSPVMVKMYVWDPWVMIHVDDSGPGVPPVKRQEIFSRGRDAGHPTSARGRGLGLFLADRLATEQKGYVWVESAPGGGASFRLALPSIATPEGSMESGPVEEGARDRFEGGGDGGDRKDRSPGQRAPLMGP